MSLGQHCVPTGRSGSRVHSFFYRYCVPTGHFALPFFFDLHIKNLLPAYCYSMLKKLLYRTRASTHIISRKGAKAQSFFLCAFAKLFMTRPSTRILSIYLLRSISTTPPLFLHYTSTKKMLLVEKHWRCSGDVVEK